jgi:hypothetical protein
LVWRSFRAAIKRSASSSAWASVARHLGCFVRRGVTALVFDLAFVESN